MFLKKRTNKSMNNSSEIINELRQEIEAASTVIIGAGSGLSCGGHGI